MLYTTVLHGVRLLTYHACRPSHMRQLYNVCAAPTKKWRPFPGGDHNSSVLEEGYFEAIADFIAEVTDERVARSKEKQ